MSNIQIGWNEATPAVSDLAGNGYAVINSLKSNVRGALDSEHEFPSTGGPAGSHRTGSARAFYGVESTVSALENGRLMVSSDNSRLFHVGSTGTMYLGAADGLSWRTTVTWGVLSQKSRVEIEPFAGTSGSLGSAKVTFTRAFQGAAPEIVGLRVSTIAQAEALPYVIQAAFIDQSSITVYTWQGASRTANVDFHGCAIGARPLG
jgi:hypothetical protein